METDTLELFTERLVLREFREGDARALLAILGDREANRFLPWFPLETLEEAQKLLREQYLDPRARAHTRRYAVCPRGDGAPIGYVHAEMDGARDFGYGLRREFWNKGIATEACRAVVARLREEGAPYLTATHDVNNPRSGAVMRRLGMTYCYSYEEQWQPKNIQVTFRMYQLNLDGREHGIYRGYWERYPVHFVEEGL